MRIVLSLILLFYVSGMSQTTRTTGASQLDLPVARTHAKPAISLQRALKLAEQFIKKQGIEISPYYLTEAKLIGADPDKGIKEPYWWFWWVKLGGSSGDYVEIGVSMSGKARRIPSM